MAAQKVDLQPGMAAQKAGSLEWQQREKANWNGSTEWRIQDGNTESVLDCLTICQFHNSTSLQGNCFEKISTSEI